MHPVGSPLFAVLIVSRGEPVFAGGQTFRSAPLPPPTYSRLGVATPRRSQGLRSSGERSWDFENLTGERCSVMPRLATLPPSPIIASLSSLDAVSITIQPHLALSLNHSLPTIDSSQEQREHPTSLNSLTTRYIHYTS